VHKNSEEKQLQITVDFFPADPVFRLDGIKKIG
jgi:hypothetical protein